MGQGFRVCPGSSPQLESRLLSFCSPWLGGAKEAQVLRPPIQTDSVPAELCRCRLPGAARGPGGAPCTSVRVSCEHPLLRFDFLPFLSRVYNFTNE